MPRKNVFLHYELLIEVAQQLESKATHIREAAKDYRKVAGDTGAVHLAHMASIGKGMIAVDRLIDDLRKKTKTQDFTPFPASMYEAMNRKTTDTKKKKPSK